MPDAKRGDVELTAETLSVVRAKAAAGCFMCKWVLEALTKDNCLRAWPPTGEGGPEFPVEGQRYHVLKEVGK
jgi:hypothetical protein